MIVRILSSGTSFKGLAAYLTHDPNANTAERVGWTHTHNLANDHVPSAIDEMLWTARDAELLKQEAGLRGGGRATEQTVKHVSLNWAPDENPTREHMIKTTEDFLRHMKWHEHQAILVAHEDKSFAHVHVAINAIHPESGLKLDDDFERRRAQKWALDYERENGRIHCEQRLRNPAEREDAPTRDAWHAFKDAQKEFERDENARREQKINSDGDELNPKNAHSAEWKRLKELQRSERERFFADGKSAFSELRSSIYREVREEYRELWAEYYADRKNGDDDETLAAAKAKIIADQKARLDDRRDAACDELRESRNGLYRTILDEQREFRAELRGRQEEGLDTASFFQSIEDRMACPDREAEFRMAAEETTARDNDQGRTDEATVELEIDASAPGELVDAATGAGASVGMGILSLFHSVMMDMEGSRPDNRPAPTNREAAKVFEAAAEEAFQRPERERVEREREERRRELYSE